MYYYKSYLEVVRKPCNQLCSWLLLLDHGCFAAMRAGESQEGVVLEDLWTSSPLREFLPLPLLNSDTSFDIGYSIKIYSYEQLL